LIKGLEFHQQENCFNINVSFAIIPTIYTDSAIMALTYISIAIGVKLAAGILGHCFRCCSKGGRSLQGQNWEPLADSSVATGLYVSSIISMTLIMLQSFA
jgi:hypothetical protein